jgi:uncharacterized protein YbcI
VWLMDDTPDRVALEEARPTSPRGEILAAVTRDLIGLHKKFYGRGATRGRAFFPHEDLLLVELRDVFTTVERTLIERGQRDAVRNTRLTFQSAMRNEFINCVESATGRKVETYESTTFTAPDRVLEIFYLEPAADRGPRLEREADEDKGGARPSAGLDESDFD